MHAKYAQMLWTSLHRRATPSWRSPGRTEDSALLLRPEVCPGRPPGVRRRRPAASGLASGAGVRRRPAASGDVRRRPAQVLSRRPAASGGVRETSTCVRRRPAASGARLGLVRPRPGPVRGTSGPRPDRRVRRTPGARFRTGPLRERGTDSTFSKT